MDKLIVGYIFGFIDGFTLLLFNRKKSLFIKRIIFCSSLKFRFVPSDLSTPKLGYGVKRSPRLEPFPLIMLQVYSAPILFFGRDDKKLLEKKQDFFFW